MLREQLVSFLVSVRSERNIDTLTRELNGLFDAVSCERGKLLNYHGIIFEFKNDGKVRCS